VLQGHAQASESFAIAQEMIVIFEDRVPKTASTLLSNGYHSIFNRRVANMDTNFKIKALERGQFSGLMGLSDRALEQANARWVVADTKPGYPCRVSLKEAEIGERVLLVPFRYHDVNSPYRASGPIYIRENAEQAELDVNEIPEILTARLLSIRAYNCNHAMVHAETLQGTGLANAVRQQFLNAEVSYIQIHNANPGCFSCSVYRA